MGHYWFQVMTDNYDELCPSVPDFRGRLTDSVIEDVKKRAAATIKANGLQTGCLAVNEGDDIIDTYEIDCSDYKNI